MSDTLAASAETMDDMLHEAAPVEPASDSSSPDETPTPSLVTSESAPRPCWSKRLPPSCQPPKTSSLSCQPPKRLPPRCQPPKRLPPKWRLWPKNRLANRPGQTANMVARVHAARKGGSHSGAPIRVIPPKKVVKVLSVGMEVPGVVRRVADFGAFVDIGVGTDGLIHVSEMSTACHQGQ
ncbi:MAG: S1 RNA-binding domain-containing protein [Anaerolineae bacterium]|nr:MAG: S1 RNA-binding domain-containing protein [Anaerolineae bacterium]